MLTLIKDIKLTHELGWDDSEVHEETGCNRVEGYLTSEEIGVLFDRSTWLMSLGLLREAGGIGHPLVEVASDVGAYWIEQDETGR